MNRSEFEAALKADPAALFATLYGDLPDLWNARLAGAGRLRYVANCLTRLRYLHPDGRLALRAKGAPHKGEAKSLIPWFAVPGARWRGTRIVFGHWSTLGFFGNADVIGLDTGCVWMCRMRSRYRSVAGRAGCERALRGRRVRAWAPPATPRR